MSSHNMREQPATPFFATYLPVFLDYLTVEKGLARNSLSSYATDLPTPQGLRDRAMLELLYATGLRVSELIHVKVDDVVMDAGFLRTMGKGSKERIVPFGDTARDAIVEYAEKARKDFDKFGDI